MLDKSIIAIIIIISELGIKELKLPQFGGGSSSPGCAFPELSWGGTHKRPTFFLLSKQGLQNLQD